MRPGGEVNLSHTAPPRPVLKAAACGKSEIGPGAAALMGVPDGALREHVTIAPPAPLVLGAYAFIADEAQLQAWAETAEAGARCVYARVDRLPRGCPIGELSRRLANEGSIVLLPQTRREAGLYDYVAKRTALSLLVEPSSPQSRRDENALAPETRLVLEHLSREADQGAPCSSNRRLANACGLRDQDQASYQVKKLRRLGFILVEQVPVEPGRVVTIVETGARTGLVGRGAA
jgi:hypothetical protein